MSHSSNMNVSAPFLVISAPDDDGESHDMDIDEQSSATQPPSESLLNSQDANFINSSNSNLFQENEFVEPRKAKLPADSGISVSPSNLAKKTSLRNNEILERFNKIKASTLDAQKHHVPPPRYQSINDSITPTEAPSAPQPNSKLLPPPSLPLTQPIMADEIIQSPVETKITPKHFRPGTVVDKPKNLPLLTVPTNQQQRSASNDSGLAVHSTEFVCYAIFRFWHSASPPTLMQIQAFRKQIEKNGPLPPNTPVPPAQWYPAFVTSVHRLLLSSGLHTQAHLPTIFLALLYVARLKAVVNPNEPKGPGSEYRVLVCSLMLAQKYLCDDRYSNKTWARLSNLPPLELNAMELEFLDKIRYKLHVQGYDWDQWLRAIETVRAGHRRWTYGLSQGLSQSDTPAVRSPPSRRESVSPMDVTEKQGPSQLNASLSVPQLIGTDDENLVRAFTWPFQQTKSPR